MTHLVDLRKKPYSLDEEAISWIEETIAQMTLDEKIGHLFVNMGSQRTEEYLTGVLNDYKIAAVRYNPGPAADIWEQNYILQTKSKIPLLIAAIPNLVGMALLRMERKLGMKSRLLRQPIPAMLMKWGKLQDLKQLQ